MKHKHIASIFGVVVLAVVIALVIFFVNKNKAEAPVPEGGGSSVAVAEQLISLPPDMVSVDHDSYLASVSGSYPKFGQADDAFNKKIADAVNGDIADFTKNASADYQAHLETGKDDFQKEFAKGGYYYFDVKSVVVQSNASFVSVVVREEGYTGGAHPFHNVFTYTYDVKNKKEILLADLYPADPNYLRNISAQVRTSLTNQLVKASDGGMLDENMKSMLDDGTDPSKPENFETFTVTPKTATFYFGEYQVAPYVYGEQSATIGR